MERKSQSANDSVNRTGLLSLPIDDLDDSIMYELLKWAIENKPPEFIKSLIEQGVNVNTKDVSGYTPLHTAAHKSPLDIMQYLIANGANVNAKTNDGWTPLHTVALVCKNVEILQYLISAGADVHAKNNVGTIPLDYAKTEETKQILREAMGLE